MINTFKYTVLSLLRNGGILVWALAFPIVLSTCFLFMFSGLDNMGDIQSIRTIVVTDGAYDESRAFQAFMKALSGASMEDSEDADDAKESGGADDSEESPLLAVTYADNEEQALDMMRESGETDSPYIGYITLPEPDEPSIFVHAPSSMASTEEINRSILVTMMDAFTSRSALVRETLDENPLALSDPAVLSGLFNIPEVTEKIDVTVNAPKESVRYYFALFGMAALFGAQVALVGVLGLLPNMGPLGSRRAISGVSHTASLMGTIFASWVVSMACLLIAYLYVRIVCGVDFSGRDGSAILVLAVSSLTATALGSAIAVIPKIPAAAKGGILTGIVCFAALFAGLYGQPTMELADMVAASFPLSQFINPAVQISQAFFSLMYYNTLTPCLEHLGVLLIMCVVLFAVSAHSLRRQRYASL